jgi:hypothetical protein
MSIGLSFPSWRWWFYPLPTRALARRVCFATAAMLLGLLLPA